jgi:actin-related protein 5
MAGVDSAGLGEVIQNLLPSFVPSRARGAVLDYPEDRTALIQVRPAPKRLLIHPNITLLQNVFLTGAPSVLPGLEQRLRAVLQSLLPPGAPLTITRAADPALDAWRGMAVFSRSDAFRRGGVGVSRAEYEEHGGERIKRWWGGNWNAAFGAAEEEEGMHVDCTIC